VSKAELWDSTCGNAYKWFKQAGLPYDRRLGAERVGQAEARWQAGWPSFPHPWSGRKDGLPPPLEYNPWAHAGRLSWQLSFFWARHFLTVPTPDPSSFAISFTDSPSLLRCWARSIRSRYATETRTHRPRFA